MLFHAQKLNIYKNKKKTECCMYTSTHFDVISCSKIKYLIKKKRNVVCTLHITFPGKNKKIV